MRERDAGVALLLGTTYTVDLPLSMFSYLATRRYVGDRVMTAMGLYGRLLPPS